MKNNLYIDFIEICNTVWVLYTPKQMTTPRNFCVLPAPLPKYLEHRKVTKFEHPENFDFMLEEDKNAYLAMKTILDAPGNEWMRSALKSQPINLNEYPQNPTLILTGFLSEFESYIPCSILIPNYKTALMDWNTFVLQYKTLNATISYHKKQFTNSDLLSIPEYHKACASNWDGDESKDFFSALRKFGIKDGSDIVSHFFERLAELENFKR